MIEDGDMLRMDEIGREKAVQVMERLNIKKNIPKLQLWDSWCYRKIKRSTTKIELWYWGGFKLTIRFNLRMAQKDRAKATEEGYHWLPEMM